MAANLIGGLVFALSIFARVAFAVPRQPIPPAKLDEPLAVAAGKETAVFTGGCFWGTQAVFERVKGVIETTAGYAGEKGFYRAEEYNQDNRYCWVCDFAAVSSESI